jgi:hypothetical protein
MDLKSKKILFWVVLLVIIITSFFVLYFQRDTKFIYKQGVSAEFDRAAQAALNIFNQEAKNRDLSNGPCLTNDLIPGWVADVVHNPREQVDDLPENQCQAYIEGRAKQFVELDLKGNIVRIK